MVTLVTRLLRNFKELRTGHNGEPQGEDEEALLFVITALEWYDDT